MVEPDLQRMQLPRYRGIDKKEYQQFYVSNKIDTTFLVLKLEANNDFNHLTPTQKEDLFEVLEQTLLDIQMIGMDPDYQI